MDDPAYFLKTRKRRVKKEKDYWKDKSTLKKTKSGAETDRTRCKIHQKSFHLFSGGINAND